MGSGGTTQQSNQSPPSEPQWLRRGLKYGAGEWEQALKDLPQLSQLFGMVPTQGVANLTPEEQANIKQLEAIGSNPGQMTAQEQAGNNTLQSFLGTQSNPSAATQAALTEFNALQAPSILQNAALMGTGTSGAALSALTQGQESAIVPFLQQDLQNKFGAAQQEIQLGGTLSDRTRNDILNSLEAAGMPREIAQQQLDAIYQQAEQQFQFAQGVQTSPLQLFGSLIGGGTGTTVTTPAKF